VSSANITVRVFDRLRKKLGEVLKQTDKPVSFHVKRAIATYRQEQEDLKVSQLRMKDNDDPIISGSEMRKLLGG
jgi:predicted DNA-binding protein